MPEALIYRKEDNMSPTSNSKDISTLTSQTADNFRRFGIIPVVVLDDPKDAEPLAEALCLGGLPCAEVTFRRPAAAEAIRIMTEKYPDMLVGAGTVLTKEQADEAINSGAKFIVSPGLNPETVLYCRERGIPMIPGTQTPSDIERALSLGLDKVKFFPAELSGGLAMLKCLASVYVNMQFMPTGGLDAKKVRDYLAFDRIFACGGTWIVKSDLVKQKKFDEIKTLVEEAVQIVREVRGT